MNWIRQEKRLAIYLRDGLLLRLLRRVRRRWRDAYARPSEVPQQGRLERGRRISRRPASAATAAEAPAASGHFCRSVALYLNHGEVEADAIERHVRNSARRAIDIPAAQNLIARRMEIRVETSPSKLKRGIWTTMLKIFRLAVPSEVTSASADLRVRGGIQLRARGVV